MANRGKHLAEGATIARVPIVEAGEGVGERTGARLRTLSMVCPGQWLIPGPTSKESENLQVQRVKEAFCS